MLCSWRKHGKGGVDTTGAQDGRSQLNWPFPSCCEPHYESEAKYKSFHTKISFVCI